ncbi:hypothetical protein DRN84_02940 [Candidatus Geothermarchaeota archaeon]|nr:MAG: hypothetical protein DRN84_02940 [Candidatus Geothermarchaeota archaeon]
MKGGLIGVGYIGVHHLRNLSRLMDEGYIDKLYASDVDESKKVYADKYNAVFFKDYAKMLEHDLDFIILAVPTKLHYNIGYEVLKNNINLLIEKPMCMKPAECLDLIKLAEDNKLILTVGHVERFNPVIQKLIDDIHKGVIGDIISMSARRHGGPRKVDTGILLDIGIHDVDIMNYICKRDIAKVYAYTLKKLSDVVNEDYGVILMEFQGDVVGTVEVGRLTSVKVRELHIIGTKNCVSLDYIKKEYSIIENYITGGGWRDYMDFIKKYTPVKKVIKVEGEEPLYIELKTFIKCIEGNEPPPVDPYDAYKAVKIIDAALESSRVGRPISL